MVSKYQKKCACYAKQLNKKQFLSDIAIQKKILQQFRIDEDCYLSLINIYQNII